MKARNYIKLCLGIVTMSFSSVLILQGENDTSLTFKPRVIISTDIGGSDPDDFQSLIHFLMYSDRFTVEGIISSPYGKGRKSDILHIINLYGQDYPKLSQHGEFPSPEYLRSVTKQGALEAAPPAGWSTSSEGSDWIIEKVKSGSEMPVWILVWGGLEDLAQALHDAPEIAYKIKVYWIGGPNKKWSANAYYYLVRNYPDLWMIENNSTYRGWIIDEECNEEFRNHTFFEKRIKDRGALGTDFGNYYSGTLKMGDSPSVAYLLCDHPDQPQAQSWGGSYAPLLYSAFREYERNTSLSDTVPVYSMITLIFKSEKCTVSGMDQKIWMDIDGQRIDGFYAGNGVFKVRFVPKRIGNWKYRISCTDIGINNQAGEFVSCNPWPGKENLDNVRLNNWWSDRTDADLYYGQYQGARSISVWREDFLTDWAKRFEWISK